MLLRASPLTLIRPNKISSSRGVALSPHTPLPRGNTVVHGLQDWWSVAYVEKILKKRRYEPATVERVYEADVYPATLDFEGWRQHRSRTRYTEHILTIFRSYMVKELMGPILATTAFAVLVCMFNSAAVAAVPIVVPGLGPIVLQGKITAAWELFSLMSFALSLMLVFRTNSSYARWVEARGQWSVIVNSGRNLVRMALASFPLGDPGLKLALGRWAVAFARVSKLHLREEPKAPGQSASSTSSSASIRQYTGRKNGDSKTTSQSHTAIELQDVLQPSEIEMVEGASHKPNFILLLMSRILYSAQNLDGSARVAIDLEIKLLQEALGGCERILRNPIPLSYTRHTARFLVMWLFLLPLAMWEKMHWGVVPATLVVSYLLFGIDEIAIQMEEPFGVLPLEVLCDGLQRNVKEMMDSEDCVQATVNNYLGSWGGEGQLPDGWENPPPATLPNDEDGEAEEEPDEQAINGWKSPRGISGAVKQWGSAMVQGGTA